MGTLVILQIRGLRSMGSEGGGWVVSGSGKGVQNLSSASRQSRAATATGCDVINRWIIGIRIFAKSCPPPTVQAPSGRKRLLSYCK